MSTIVLQAQRLNDGQSEIYVERDGKDSPRKLIATNELFGVTARFCSPEAFTTFHRTLLTGLNTPATLNSPNLDEIAAELRLPR